MLSQIKLKNRKGVSVIIGYILLIAFALSMSVGVYVLFKSFVPAESLSCPDGVSLFIRDYACDSTTLNLTIKNNGRFNVGGYFIHVTNDSSRDLATIDLSSEIISGGMQADNAIWIISAQENSLEPNEEIVSIFDTSSIGTVYSVEIIPIRSQEVENKIRTVSCSSAKIQTDISC